MADTLKLGDGDAAAPSSDPYQLLPDPLIGREVGGYIVEAPIGEGGMGLVYKARHPILARHFAIKVLRPEAAQDARISGSFEREAQTLSSLKHPHIIDIVGFGALDDGRQYMVMEFVTGKTLHDELDHGAIDVHRAIRFADQILDGLDAAHSVGVIHRDLKPGNVLIAKVSGGSEVLKLLDFGLAKQQPESLVGSFIEVKEGASVIAGTPEYIAPEQAMGKHAGKHSDLYSFGIMLFEMLTGFQPFLPDAADADRIRSLLKMHLHTPPPTLGTVGTFPAELEELVADLLKKDPADRPSSANTVRARLQKVQRLIAKESTAMVVNPLLVPGPPVTAPLPPGPPSSSTELAGQRRSPLPWVAAGVALLLLLGGGGAFWAGRSAAKPLMIAAPPADRAPQMAAVAVDPSPAPVPAPAPAAVVPAPAPAPVVVARATPPPHPPRKLSVTIGAPAPEPVKVQINRSGCEPNDRWRSEARSNLGEIQSNAAAGQDKAAWARFEKEEASLSAAIAAASSGVECDAVVQKIEQLARTFPRPTQ